MSVDFPRAWQIAKSADINEHDEKCSFFITQGGLLCDCHILSTHPESKDNILQGENGIPCRDKNGRIIESS